MHSFLGTGYRRVAQVFAVILVAATLSGCGVNAIPTLDEDTTAK